MMIKEKIKKKVVGGCTSHTQVKSSWAKLYATYAELTGHSVIKNPKHSKLAQVECVGNLSVLWAILNDEPIELKPMTTKQLDNPNIDPAIHVMIAGRRYHKIDEKLAYPGVTTVLKETGNSFMKKIFEDYYAKNVRIFGQGRADKIKALPSARGTFLHNTIEDYLKTSRDQRENHYIHRTLAKHLVPFLDRIVKIHGIEIRLVNHDFGFAGSADLIATLDDGKTYVIDWKTSKNNLYPSNTVDYQVQGSCYAETFETETGIQVDGLILMVLFTVPQLKARIRSKMLVFGREHCQSRFDEFVPRLWEFNKIVEDEIEF